MKKNTVIVSGDYTPKQVKQLERDFDTIFIENLEKLLEIPLSDRERIKGIAFKGHKPLEFSSKQLDLVPNLGIISNFGVGFDGIDINEATTRGIKVTNTPGVLTDDVADLAVGMLIALSRQFLMGVDWIKSGNWKKFGEMPLNRTISSQKAGVLGLGRIGRAIAQRLSAFSMEIHYYSRSKKPDAMDWKYHSDPVALAAEVDFLFVALVGGEETNKLVSSQVITALGSDGILVNISRGSTVDEDALLLALQSGSIRGAALDVFVGEPNINLKFFDLDNVFLQPHQGSGTIESREAMSKLQRDNLSNFFNNMDLITPVN